MSVFLLSRLKLQDPQLFWGYPIAQVEDLYAYHAPLGIKIKNNARLYLLGFGNS